MKWTFEIYNNWEEIWSEAHLIRWHAIMNTSPTAHVFFHPSLVKAWVDTYLPLRKLTPIFIWGKNTDGNEAFLPLVLWKKNWKNAFLKTIIPVGYSDYDYHDPIFQKTINPDEINVFWRDINLLLQSFPYDEIVLDGIHQFFLPPMYNIISNEPCPYIPLENYNDIDEFKNQLKSKLRQDINRRIRKLQESGETKYIVYNKESINEALKTIPHMLKLHAQRWPKAYKAPHFHENLIIEGLSNETLHFSQINLNGIPISWRIGFIFKDRFYSYMPTINSDYQMLSPGKLHLIFCIEQAILNNLKIYDQLRGTELYKSEWTNQSSMIYNVQNSSRSFFTKSKHAFYEIRKLIR